MEIVLAIVSILLIICVFLSLIKNDFWIYKLLEYPRLQKLVVIAIATACWLLFWALEETFYKVVFGALGLSIIYLGLYKWLLGVF